MDPVTHFLTGATLARTGFNRKAAYATLAMTLAAETPDLDVLWSARGPVAGFQHHRGITHTFLGLPFEAALVLGAVFLVHRYRERRVRAQAIPTAAADPTADEPIIRPLTYAPIRWALLYGFILIALLSHLLLDWTNNYGLRPFFPFNPRWYAGSFVFIVDPIILLLLFSAFILPALFGLIACEVGARRTRFRGRGWAIFALVAIACLWTLRFFEHSTALDLAAEAAYGPVSTPHAPTVPPSVLRTEASPSPIDPFVWHTVAETPGFYQLATIDARRGTVDTDPERDILPKPPTTLSTLIAKRSPLGEAYLDWSSWPAVTDLGPTPLPPGIASNPSAPLPNEVIFRDLRFAYDVPGLDGRQNPPLSGQVFIDLTQPDTQRIVATIMDNHIQH